MMCLHARSIVNLTQGANSVTAPRLWNGLPDSIRVTDSLELSKSRLNTYLFKNAFADYLYKVKSSPRHYALGSHEGLYGQCLNLVSVVRSNLECSYTDSPGRDTSPSQVPSKQCLYSFAAE